MVGDHVLKEKGVNVEIYQDTYLATAYAHTVLIMTECDQFRTYTSTFSLKLGAIQTKVHKSKTTADPRPFQRLERTESEILLLEKYLSSKYSTPNPL